MNPFTLAGIGSVVVIAGAAVVERHSHWLTLVIAAACVALAVCAFEVGLWYVGVLGLLGYLVATRRWVDRQSADDVHVQ